MGFDGFAELLDSKPRGVVLLSPSQIEKWDSCKRKWAFEYIGGIRPPPHPSAELGTIVHAILEAWLNFATPPDTTTKAGKIAARMIANLPLPGTGITERTFYFRTRNGLFYQGKIDWSGIFYGWPTIIDHKTTGNMSYAKTEAALHNDVQGLSYTIAGCLGFQVDNAQLMWNYGTTKDRDPVVTPVRTRIHLKVAQEKFDNIVDPMAAEIVAARTSRLNPHSFPPNANACNEYGGCPHRHICNLTEEERIRSLMTEQNNPTLAARLASMPMGAPGFAPPGGNGFTPPGAPQQQPFVPQQPQFVPQQPQQYVQQPQFQPAPGFVPPGGQVQQPQQGFTPPGAPQNGFTPPGAPQQQPNGFTPPGAAPGAFAPPAGPYNPNVGPNPPESGAAMPQAQQAPQQPNVAPNGAPPEETKKRPRGRPRKGEGAAEESSAVAPVDPMQRAAFVEGVAAFMRNPGWTPGNVDQLIWAGDCAVQAYNARFG